MITRWPLERVLREVTESTDLYYFNGSPDTWLALMASKLDGYNLSALLDEIEAVGILDPICIIHRDNDVKELGNGHHRLTAALLLGLDTILVDESGDFMSAASEENEHRLPYTVRFHMDDSFGTRVAEALSEATDWRED